jgi:hypothetical protein
VVLLTDGGDNGSTRYSLAGDGGTARVIDHALAHGVRVLVSGSAAPTARGSSSSPLAQGAATSTPGTSRASLPPSWGRSR